MDPSAIYFNPSTAIVTNDNEGLQIDAPNQSTHTGMAVGTTRTMYILVRQCQQRVVQTTYHYQPTNQPEQRMH